MTPFVNFVDSSDEASSFVRGSLSHDPSSLRNPSNLRDLSSLRARLSNRRLSAALRLRLAGGSDAVCRVHDPSSSLEKVNSCLFESLLTPENKVQQLFKSSSSPSLSIEWSQPTLRLSSVAFTITN
jgi:hypothetical protein